MNQELFSNGKIHGPSPWDRGLGGAVVSVVDQAGSVDHGRGGSRCDQRWGSGGSPVGVGDEEGDEVKLRVCSPVHGQ
jgi:hypothetical protein